MKIQEDDITRFVNQMKHNKANGYRRVGPSEPATRQEESGNKDGPNKGSKRDSKKYNDDEVTESDEKADNFCHFHNNYRKCTFEENTGQKCKFDHKKHLFVLLMGGVGAPNACSNISSNRLAEGIF